MAETLRSIVHPWECDSVEHFTTAYYFRAYGSAQWHLLQLLGFSEDEIAAMRPHACRTGFSRELRAGDAYHIESGVVDHGPDRLTLGHRLLNSETGELGSTHLQSFSGRIGPLSGLSPFEWEDESPRPEIDFDRYGPWSTTGHAVVHARDLDHTGMLDLCPLIHHTSDANVQFQNMIGMTSSYMQEKRIGFATFAYRIRIHELPRRAGTVLRTDTALAHLGRSSLWLAHRVVDKATEAPIADVAQLGVHFDRVGRRPATIPEDIRERAGGFVSDARA
jgi:acyl-CoA thioesterase FadM